MLASRLVRGGKPRVDAARIAPCSPVGYLLVASGEPGMRKSGGGGTRGGGGICNLFGSGVSGRSCSLALRLVAMGGMGVRVLRGPSGARGERAAGD